MVVVGDGGVSLLNCNLLSVHVLGSKRRLKCLLRLGLDHESVSTFTSTKVVASARYHHLTRNDRNDRLRHIILSYFGLVPYCKLLGSTFLALNQQDCSILEFFLVLDVSVQYNAPLLRVHPCHLVRKMR